ncbi:MAG: aldo/keto reductase [Candidatus Heimdallarchaeota archaeon]|nr:aldo/keto reductase [Candidatus Heimdallarchaeota archaeon]MCK4768823.1 aldo/keto reductase [Candidatus Heimdallarchaeota archaeon]
MLEKRKLGKTDIEVSPIGIGVMMWMGGKGLMGRMAPNVSEEIRNEIIKESFAGGINFFDTAEMYGFGNSEANLAKALKANNIEDKDVIIGTKWGPIFRRARNMRRTINNRIRYLDGYTVDLYMIHQPLSFSSIKTEMKELARLVENKKVRSVGISNYNAEKMRKAHEELEKLDIPLAANQVHYSLVRRNIETDGILDTAKELGVTITAYTPLAGGLLTGKLHNNPEALKNKFAMYRVVAKRNLEKSIPIVKILTEIGKAHDVLPGQVALNWLVTYHGDTVVTIPGATKTYQAIESAGAMSFNLSKTELEEIAEVSEIFL